MHYQLDGRSLSTFGGYIDPICCLDPDLGAFEPCILQRHPIADEVTDPVY